MNFDVILHATKEFISLASGNYDIGGNSIEITFRPGQVDDELAMAAELAGVKTWQYADTGSTIAFTARELYHTTKFLVDSINDNELLEEEDKKRNKEVLNYILSQVPAAHVLIIKDNGAPEEKIFDNSDEALVWVDQQQAEVLPEDKWWRIEIFTRVIQPSGAIYFKIKTILNPRLNSKAG